MFPVLAFEFNENPLDDVLPHTYFSVGPLHFTNTVVMATFAALLMLLIFPRLFNRPDSSAPKGAKNFFEAILEYLRVEVIRPALKEHTDKFVPFLWTLFFFILFCNVLSCVPIADIVGLVTGGHVTHMGGAATGTLSTTVVLALVAFFMIHAHGIDQVAKSLMDGTYGHHNHDHSHEDADDIEHARSEALGAAVPGDFGALTDPTAHYKDADAHAKPTYGRHEDHALGAIAKHDAAMTPLKAMVTAVPLYLWNFAPHPFRPTEPDAPWTKWVPDIFMWGFLLILEMLGAFIKPVALALRLFGNMVAGHVLLATLVLLIVAVHGIGQLAIGVPMGLLYIGISVLELFVAFLQAYIFVFLTTLFLASAIAPEH